MDFNIGNLVSAVVGAIAQVGIAAGVSFLKATSSEVLAAQATIANILEDGKIDEDEEELFEEAVKVLVGAFILSGGSGSSNLESDDEKNSSDNDINYK